MQCMELKLGTHVYLSVSMTTMNKKLPQALFPVTISSFLKFAHHTMRGGETWYTCIFQRSMTIVNKKQFFPITTSSFTLSVYKNERRLVNKKFPEF